MKFSLTTHAKAVMNRTRQFLTNKTDHIAAFSLGLLPAVANAGFLSQGICRPYRQLVDNELFMIISVIAAVILVIAWKLAPSGQILARGVGLLAALAVGLNIENILQLVVGGGMAC